MFQFDEFFPSVKEWIKSTHGWKRRASAVTMIYSIRRKKGLKQVFEIADVFLKDADVIVQKGYGWMLKEAGIIQRKLLITSSNIERKCRAPH
jgi:3-methyladenine DNA glycosylase AlkD